MTVAERGAMPRLTLADIDAVRDWYGRMGAPKPHQADVDRLYDSMLLRLRKDPLLERYVNHLGNGEKDNRNTEPWMAAGEQRYAAFLSLCTALPQQQDVLVFPDKHATRELAVMLAIRCLMAVPYLWLNDVENLVSASPLPSHVLGRNLLPHPAVFFSQETARDVHDANGKTAYQSNWTLLFDEGLDGFSLTMDISSGPLFQARDGGFGQQVTQTRIANAGVNCGRKFPDDITDPVERQATERILQRLAFIRSPYTVSESTRLPRPVRRDLQRHDAWNPDPVVQVVKLRRALEHRPPSEPGDGVEWRHHWWVSGHYRAQWHPSTRDHEVIWIGPHVKGPLNKPLLEKVYAVVR